MIVKTRGIVLGQIPMRDQDRKLILLTTDMGLIEVIARGVGGKKAKIAAAAELPSDGNYTFTHIYTPLSIRKVLC